MLIIRMSVSTNRHKWLTTGFTVVSFFYLLRGNMNIYLEIFGYLGTALVIISMLMTDINKLRIINISGGVISLIYAICVNTMPVVVLNATLVTINTIQLVRSKINRRRFESQRHEYDEIAENNEEGETL